jgi:metal-responsive CopG/Arc/MetJ family transcriptional regulator
MSAVRLNISLPQKTVKKLKKNVKPRERSMIIAEALELYFERNQAKTVLEEMIEGYIATSEEDLRMAHEMDGTLMDGLENETW